MMHDLDPIEAVFANYSLEMQAISRKLRAKC